MSTHIARVYEVKMRPHPDADALSLMDLPNGNVAVMRTEDWKDGELAVHCEPDFEANTDHPAFEFLQIKDEQGFRRKQWERIKPKRLRGIRSFGIMVPIHMLPNMEGLKVGDNALENGRLEGLIRRWEQIERSSSGEAAPAPDGVIAPTYDIESYTLLAPHFVEGEEVVATEKLHGQTLRAVCVDGELHVGSGKEWKIDREGCARWAAMRNTPNLEAYLRANEGHVVYGEEYGQNPGYGYGTTKNNRLFAAFDVLIKSPNGPMWADYDTFCAHMEGIPKVPLIYRGAYDIEKMKQLAEGKTTMPGAPNGDIREGIVVKPIRERITELGDRLVVKFVSLEYLCR